MADLEIRKGGSIRCVWAKPRMPPKAAAAYAAAFLWGSGGIPPQKIFDALRHILVHSGAVEKRFNRTSKYAKKPARTQLL